MQKYLKQSKALTVALLLMVSPLFLHACAQQSTVQQEQVTEQHSGKKHKKTIPAEAFTACEGLSSGTACSVTTPRGTMTGTCKDFKGEGTLVCAPAGGKKRRHHAH